MRTKTINIYSFSELSADAKERAKMDYRENCDYHYANEAIDSIGKLAEHFGGKMVNYSICWDGSSYSNARFDMPDDMETVEISERLSQLGSFDEKTLRGHGDCVLTGFCMDEAAIDGFRMAFHAGEIDLQKLMDAAFDSLVKASQEDYGSQFDDETFAEMADANTWEFYADGSTAR